jgi:hypothetical protein
MNSPIPKSVRNALSLLLICLASFTPWSCNDDGGGSLFDPFLRLRVNFDTQGERFDANGELAEVPEGRAAYTPEMRELRISSIELVPDENTPVGQGVMLYEAATRVVFGEEITELDQTISTAGGIVANRFNFQDIPAGTYPYVRVGLASAKYQLNYDLHYHVKDSTDTDSIPPDFTVPVELTQLSGGMAVLYSDAWVNTLTPFNITLDINQQKRQGYYAFETSFTSSFELGNNVYVDSLFNTIPTLPNPISATAPTPESSGIITGVFDTPLEVTGQESEDVLVDLTFSTNQAFEWVDPNNDGRWDVWILAETWERISDFGLRSLEASWE